MAEDGAMPQQEEQRHGFLAALSAQSRAARILAQIGFAVLPGAGILFAALVLGEPFAHSARLRDSSGLLWISRRMPVASPRPVPTPSPTPHPSPTVSPRPVTTAQALVHSAGGQSGDVEMTLKWDTRDDLDFHLRTPDDEELSYENKGNSNGLHLDIDENVDGDREHAVEHFVIGRRERLVPGTYHLSVVHFQTFSQRHTPFTVILKGFTASTNGPSEQTLRGESDEHPRQVEVCAFEVDASHNISLLDPHNN